MDRSTPMAGNPATTTPADVASDASPEPRLKVQPATRKALLILHLAVSVGVIGAGAALLTLVASGLGGADPAMVYPAAELIARNVIVPLMITALATGLVQGFITIWGVLRNWWVVTKLALTVTLVGVALFVLVPSVSDAAQAAIATGVPFDYPNQVLLVIFPTVALTAFVIITTLAVYKPFGRTRRSQPTQAAQ
jgi:hypothetical protein